MSAGGHLRRMGPAPSTELIGRDRELAELTEALDQRGPRLITVTGPRGRGKTVLLSRALGGCEALQFQACDLTDQELLGDFQELARQAFGEIPLPQRPGILPVGTGLGAWLSILMGIVDLVEANGRPLVLALDGMEALLGARRKLAGVIGEAFTSARSRTVPLRLVLTARDRRTLAPLVGPGATLGPPDLELSLRPLPFRAAGWAHGAVGAGDAFRRWTIFGDEPAHLPRGRIPRTLDDAVVTRILMPGGDLFEAPLRRIETTFQRPARYAGILRALARGPRDWSGILGRTRGIDSGGQLAPYLRRLEEEGLVRTDLPLDARPGSRARRYSVADPLYAFWFGWVLPRRSLLHALDPREVWRTIQPELTGHFQSWMEEAARRWLREHSDEAFASTAREVGALWGDEVDFPVAGRLSNGQVCFGLVEWDAGREELAQEMATRMKASRYGIGRESRTPIFFLAGEEGEAVRRMVARVPFATLVDLERLMGPAPRSGSRKAAPGSGSPGTRTFRG